MFPLGGQITALTKPALRFITTTLFFTPFPPTPLPILTRLTAIVAFILIRFVLLIPAATRLFPTPARFNALTPNQRRLMAIIFPLEEEFLGRMIGLFFPGEILGIIMLTGG